MEPISPSKTRIGWIGIGVMGSAMASRLLSANYKLTIYARNPSKSLSLQSKGALLASSPSQLCECDVIFTMLGQLAGKKSFLKALSPAVLAVSFDVDPQFLNHFME